MATYNEAKTAYEKMMKYLPTKIKSAGMSGLGVAGTVAINAESNAKRNMAIAENNYARPVIEKAKETSAEYNDLVSAYGDGSLATTSDWNDKIGKIVDADEISRANVLYSEWQNGQNESIKQAAKSDLQKAILEGTYTQEELADIVRGNYGYTDVLGNYKSFAKGDIADMVNINGVNYGNSQTYQENLEAINKVNASKAEEALQTVKDIYDPSNTSAAYKYTLEDAIENAIAAGATQESIDDYMKKVDDVYKEEKAAERDSVVENAISAMREYALADENGDGVPDNGGKDVGDYVNNVLKEKYSLNYDEKTKVLQDYYSLLNQYDDVKEGAKKQDEKQAKEKELAAYAKAYEEEEQEKVEKGEKPIIKKNGISYYIVQDSQKQPSGEEFEKFIYNLKGEDGNVMHITNTESKNIPDGTIYSYEGEKYVFKDGKWVEISREYQNKEKILENTQKLNVGMH